MLDVLVTRAQLTVDADQVEAAAVVNRVATREWDIGHIIAWLAEHLAAG